LETKEGENIMGLFDDLADIATGKKTKKETHTYKKAQAQPESQEAKWMQRDDVKKSFSNAESMAEDPGFKTEGQKAAEKKAKETKKVVTTTEDEKVVTEEKPKEQFTYYDDKLGRLNTTDLRLLEKKIGQKAIIRNGKIFFVDEMGSTIPAFAMLDKLGGVLDEWTGFDPAKVETMGDTGRAALYNKFDKMAKLPENESKKAFEEFLNRKGNLGRILKYSGNINIEDLTARNLADMIRGTAGDSESFRTALEKEQNPQDYWNRPENHPRTQGDVEEAARAGVTWIEGYGPVERPEGQGGGISGLGGGGGGALPPTDPTTDPTKVPDYVLKQQYMPGFTPDYSGGAEQMHIAGGYWDPITKKWIGQGPWGTQNQYQFNQGGIVGTSPLLFKNKGGMVNDGGIKSFKKYGY
jgi:hypothetical protein